jgi:hypothetical protein
MPAIPSELTSLDFYEIKESIKSYLRTRTEFTDYDFEGSSASYLIDTLAYNTYYTAFNANMAMNEAFLESATVRDNIVRIAKQLNYTPRSIKAARACVQMVIQCATLAGGQTYPDTVTIKKGDIFISRNNTDTFPFCLLKDTQASVDQNTGLATFSKMIIYQGNLLSYHYTVDDTQKQDFVIPAENVDTEILTVSVKPTEQSVEVDEYSLSTNVVELTSTSRNYFLEETEDLRYKVVFGDGVLGRKLIDNEFIILKYVVTAGDAANGCTKFSFIGSATDSADRPISPASMSLGTIDSSEDGAERESALSVKFRAPRSFSTQNRAVTEDDYAYIVSSLYPQAAAVTAYGGEKLNPPIYGKVYIAVRSKSGVNLNTTTKTRIKNQLLKYSMASIEPVIVDPRIFYVVPKVYPFFNGNETSRSANELATEILKSIDRYNTQNRDGRFGDRIEASKFNSMVDASDDAISGSTTQFTMGQNLDQFTFGNIFTQCLDFGNPITNPSDTGGNDAGDSTCPPKFSSMKSGKFYATGYTENLADLVASGETAYETATPADEVIYASGTRTTEVLVPVNIRDDGKGNLLLVATRNEKEVVLNASIGTIDYGKGIVCVGPLNVADTGDGTNRIPVVVHPITDSIIIPPGVDPTIFNPEVYPIDFVTNPTTVSNFDPNNFSGWSYGGTPINIIEYPVDAFTYPEITTCF